MSKLKVIDLFAGCGGLSEGFEQSGVFNVELHVEWEKEFCDTILKRVSKSEPAESSKKKVVHFDIQRTQELLHGWMSDKKFNADQYYAAKGISELKNEHIDAIIGGPPCQAYSMAGRVRDKDGMHYDYRNYLFESYIEIVNFFKPKFFIFENVEGMLSAKPGGVSITDRIRDGFDKIGFEIVDDIRGKALLNTADYGVPQIRKRVILLGLNKKVFENNRQDILNTFYKVILPKYKTKKWATVREAISDLPTFKVANPQVKIDGRLYSHLPVDSKFLNHIPRYHSVRDIEIFRDLAKDLYSKNQKYKTVEDIKKLYTDRTGKQSNVHKYYVQRWDEPSKTITAHMNKDGLRYIHPDYKQARSLTVREAARLQTFPDDYEFTGSMGSQYKMIGNAVPPLFAKVIALALKDLLKIAN